MSRRWQSQVHCALLRPKQNTNADLVRPTGPSGNGAIEMVCRWLCSVNRQNRRQLQRQCRRKLRMRGQALRPADQMLARDMTVVDVENVIRIGNITRPAEFERGSWRYAVETARMRAVVAFTGGHEEIVLVTAMRKP